MPEVELWLVGLGPIWSSLVESLHLQIVMLSANSAFLLQRAAQHAGSSLVNDLSLSVRAAGLGGMPLLGNGWNDTVNNAESVGMLTLDC
jgi:hypothetical protein